MTKKRKTTQERELEGLQNLRVWAYQAGLSMGASKLHHLLDTLNAWLDQHEHTAGCRMAYQERLALYNGYFDAAETRKLLTKAE